LQRGRAHHPVLQFRHQLGFATESAAATRPVAQVSSCSMCWVLSLSQGREGHVLPQPARVHRCSFTGV
jgi:hypothetical protein